MLLPACQVGKWGYPLARPAPYGNSTFPPPTFLCVVLHSLPIVHQVRATGLLGHLPLQHLVPHTNIWRADPLCTQS